MKWGTVFETVAGLLTITTAIVSISAPDKVAYKVALAVLAFISFSLSIVITLVSVKNEKRDKDTLEKKNAECEQLKEKISELEYELYKASVYASDGRKMLLNSARVGFNPDIGTYSITIRRCFSIIDSTLSSTIINLYVDRFPDDKAKSAEYYSQHRVDWDKIGLTASLKVVHKDGSEDVYENLIIRDIQRLNSRWVLQVNYSNEETTIPFTEGDVCEFTYSFDISNEYWGNYLARPISYYQEKTEVDFIKCDSFNKDAVKVFYVDKLGNAVLLQKRHLKWIDKGDYYTLEIDAKKSAPQSARGNIFKMYWDANTIFGRNDLNAQCVEELGIRAVMVDED